MSCQSKIAMISQWETQEGGGGRDRDTERDVCDCVPQSVFVDK